MTMLEDQLAIALRNAVDGVRPSPDLLERATRAHHRRTVVRRGAAAGATTGLAAAAAVALGVAGGSGSATLVVPGPPPVATRASTAAVGPRPKLVPALTATAGTSYRLELRNSARSARDTTVYADFTGVVDSARGLVTGVNRLQGTVAQVRVVDGIAYTNLGDERWVAQSGSLGEALVLNGRRHDTWWPSDGSSVDATLLLGRLRERGTVTLTHSAGGVDTYAIGYVVPGDASVAAHKVTGVVRVDTRTGFVTRIRTSTTVTGAHPEVADGDALTFSLDMTFGDFGVPVRVEAPPRGLVDRPGTSAPSDGSVPAPSATTRR